ncbi:MAG: glycoside hydrolase family 5 protein [Planctomycetaceae bacterium]
MRQHSLSILILALVAVSAFAADPAPSVSLIANGNLEADTNSDQWPDGWARAKSGVRWQAEEGNHFLRLVSDKPGEMVLLYHAVKLPEGCRALTLSWRMRCSDLKPGKQPWFDARVLLEFKDAAGNKLAGGPSAPYTRKSTVGWVERRVSFLVPDGARTLEFMPSLFQVERGTFDLDDVMLLPTDPAPLEEATKLASAATKEKQAKAAAAARAKAAVVLQKDGSLLSNGHFETDKNVDGWPDDWGRLKTGGRWETENENHFLRLTATEPGQTILLYRAVDLPAGVEALDLSWRQRISDLKPGKEPYFDARIMLEFKDESGKKVSQKPAPPYTRSNTSGWVEKHIQFLVPPEALTLEFMPALFQVERGTFDLDDFVLKPTEAASLFAAAKAAMDAEKLAYVPPETPQLAKWPPQLHVEGNQILNPDGKPVWLQGVNVVSLEWSAGGERVMKSALVAVEDWKANAIRLPVKEEYWFGRTAGQKDGGKSYRELVNQVITLVANRGAYVVLDLHRFRAPKPAHVEFWKDAAATYKNHPAVLFDLFNEPHGISWEVWRNGGFVTEKDSPADEKANAALGFQSPGMQRMLEAVRETGAHNIVIAGGLDWAYDLSGIANGFALTEKGGHGIVYSTHIYPWKRDWASKVLLVADKHPIFVGEVGADIKKMSFIPAEAQEDAATWVPEMLGLIQKHKLHWTAFSFHPKASPVMITDWDYTPTPFWGAFAKEALSGKPFELKRLR